MGIARLDHYSIRTTDLEGTRRFYTEVLGFTVGPRPDFPFPGVWLYHAGIAVVHVIGIDPNDSNGLQEYLGDREQEGAGSGMIDHVAFLASDFAGLRATIAAYGLEFRERQVPAMAMMQLFVEDPSGITIELNFPA